jgi:hypothetical protein
MLRASGPRNFEFEIKISLFLKKAHFVTYKWRLLSVCTENFRFSPFNPMLIFTLDPFEVAKSTISRFLCPLGALISTQMHCYAHGSIGNLMLYNTMLIKMLPNVYWNFQKNKFNENSHFVPYSGPVRS